MATVFYSWQSDLPGNTNRSFIGDALKKALRALSKDEDVYEPPRDIDTATAGVAGSARIDEKIFEKIDAASACVFDVSIVAENKVRKLPNPNVLVELGYALKAHPDARVIMVLNKRFGQPEELPFDLRQRQVLVYEAEEVGADEKPKAKADLVNGLVAAFKATFRHNEANRFTPAEVAFFDAIYDNARGVLNLRAELADRNQGLHFGLLRDQAGSIGDTLRNLATEDAAHQHPGIVDDLKACANRLDTVKAWLPRMSGHAYQEFVTFMDAADAAARTLLEKATPAVRQKIGNAETLPYKRKLARQARDQFERLKTAVEQRDSTHFAAIREALEGTGRSMLMLAAALEVLGDADAGDFRPAAHVLHVAAIRKSDEASYREVGALVARIDPVLKPLARFA